MRKLRVLVVLVGLGIMELGKLKLRVVVDSGVGPLISNSTWSNSVCTTIENDSWILKNLKSDRQTSVSKSDS